MKDRLGDGLLYFWGKFDLRYIAHVRSLGVSLNPLIKRWNGNPDAPVDLAHGEILAVN